LTDFHYWQVLIYEQVNIRQKITLAQPDPLLLCHRCYFYFYHTVINYTHEATWRLMNIQNRFDADLSVNKMSLCKHIFREGFAKVAGDTGHSNAFRNALHNIIPFTKSVRTNKILTTSVRYLK
jgi:hypothetical protein